MKKIEMKLNVSDLNMIEVALRLRSESEEDNGNLRLSHKYEKVHAKIESMLDSMLAIANEKNVAGITD